MPEAADPLRSPHGDLTIQIPLLDRRYGSQQINVHLCEKIKADIIYLGEMYHWIK